MIREAEEYFKSEESQDIVVNTSADMAYYTMLAEDAINLQEDFEEDLEDPKQLGPLLEAAIKALRKTYAPQNNRIAKLLEKLDTELALRFAQSPDQTSRVMAEGQVGRLAPLDITKVESDLEKFTVDLKDK